MTIKEALSKLAALYEYGELEIDTAPTKFIQKVVTELKDSRERLAKCSTKSETECGLSRDWLTHKWRDLGLTMNQACDVFSTLLDDAKLSEGEIEKWIRRVEDVQDIFNSQIEDILDNSVEYLRSLL